MKAHVYQFLTGALALALLALVLQAPPLAAADDDDPPSRVARLNFSQGPVSFQPAGDEDWVTAVPNRPLVTGDTLWADEGARAELHIGSTAIRLDRDTEITLLELGDHVTQIRLAQGSMIVRLRHLDDDDSFEVDTPNLAFSPLSAGDYRIDVDPQGAQTVTTVWQGRAEATGGGQNYQVLAGQQVRFSGADPLDFDIEQIPRADNFAAWAAQRDLREDRADSANYVSREMTGYEDLDDYGQWRYVASYGPVWVPAAVPVGWAPYRFGHWAWIRPWGWTWVEDEPWGFAPFHYGRWAFAGGFWCWVPGPVVVRPVYAPALVVFAGGDGFRVAAGPGVAWFPLAPGEVYVPPYRVSRVYVTNINTTNTVVNVTRITNVYNNYNTNNLARVTYMNQHVGNAVTVVSHDTFVNARPVARNTVQVSQREIEQAPLAREAPATPVRTSVWGAGRPTRGVPPPTVVNRPVISRRPTPPPQPAPFSEKQVESRRVQEPQQPQQPAQPPARGPIDRQGKLPPLPPPGTDVPQKPAPDVRLPQTPAPGVRPEHGTISRPAETSAPPRPAPAAAPTPPPSPHPLVRPAPPVQDKSPQQWKEEETKQGKWRQQRETSVPPKNEPSPEPPRRQDRPR
ncbi:MAG TPA: DUF6600 domain-containing protein [Terriglobales bacterium]|nr:DUF6600 domain-containing protein [Terriglobales bacterium]